MRGQGANILILEEAAYIKESVFHEVVLPLIGVNNVAVLGISTPDNEFNYYSELVNMKKKTRPGDPNSDDTSEGVFHVLEFGLHCEDCAKRRIKCLHKDIELPEWKSRKRQELTEELMSSNMARMQRELQGMIIGSSVFCFNEYSRAMFDAQPYRFENKPPVLHLGIDPSGGGEGSDYSYVLTANENGVDVIIAYQAIGTHKTDQIYDMFNALFGRIRKSKLYCDALVKVHCEANMSWMVPYDMQQMMKNEPAVYKRVEFTQHLSKNKEEKPGVLTGAEEKRLYVQYVRQKMSEGKLRFAEELLGESVRIGKQRDELKKQLDAYRCVKKESADPEFVDAKYTYTGKSSGRRDDLCMALQIALYNMKKTECSFDFRQRMQDEGGVFCN